MQTYRHFLGLTLANTHVICKDMNHNEAMCHSSSSCSPAFQQTIAGPPLLHSHVPQHSQSAWLRASETAAPALAHEPGSVLEGAVPGGIPQGQVCLKGRQKTWESATASRALSQRPPEPSSRINCHGPKESSPEESTAPTSPPSALCRGVAI